MGDAPTGVEVAAATPGLAVLGAIGLQPWLRCHCRVCLVQKVPKIVLLQIHVALCLAITIGILITDVIKNCGGRQCEICRGDQVLRWDRPGNCSSNYF